MSLDCSVADVTHFESADRALPKDRVFISTRKDNHRLCYLRHLVSEGTLPTITTFPCAVVVPLSAVIEAVVELGASGTELVEYTHSGAVTGENENVVGYAWLVIH